MTLPIFEETKTCNFLNCHQPSVVDSNLIVKVIVLYREEGGSRFSDTIFAFMKDR